MKKIYILLVSIICFFVLIFISVPYLIENEKFTIQKLQYSLLDKDNLYENYSHNYAIKIPKGYKTDKGIGKYSSVQFHNEQLGYVIAVNLGKSDYKDISLQQNNYMISELAKGYQAYGFYSEIIENSIFERGYNTPYFLEGSKVNYNNRNFLNLVHKARRRSDKSDTPVNMSSFITYYNDYFYIIQFISYKFSSKKNWEIEIEKSMPNIFINKFITEKD